MTAPLTLSFEVGCPPERAFSLWTTRIDTWWPRDHTVSGGDVAEIVLQAGVGGRIYERTSDGREHEWGEVTAWSPPGLLAYRWHLRQDRADATEVEVRFLPHGEGATLVKIEHRGWERLGQRADSRREQNRAGWDGLIRHYQVAVDDLVRRAPATARGHQ